jgi:hypothetical protein
VKRHLMRGHNRPPRQQSIRTRWAKALFADPDTPAYVMAMAWAIHWYSDPEGCGAAVSNEQFEAICGISRPTSTKGKKWLLDNGYVTIRAGDGRGLKSTFRMTIPVARKEETALPLSDAKGETLEPVTVLPLCAKGETSGRKGETSEHKGATRFPPILDYSGDIQEKRARERATPTRNEIDELHRIAFQAGQAIKGGTTAKSNRATAKTKGELDGSGGVLFENGKLTVFNGVRAALTQDFPGIDLQTVCDRAGPEITRMNWPTTQDAIACIRKWASIIKGDMRQRPSGAGPPKPTGKLTAREVIERALKEPQP